MPGRGISHCCGLLLLRQEHLCLDSANIGNPQALAYERADALVCVCKMLSSIGVGPKAG